MSQSLHKITFISTVHEEIGKCDADELNVILEKLNPEVIFLEALESTYSTYDKMKFSSFGVYHEKLEIKAIQKYSYISTAEYVPVLDNGLPEVFEDKYNLVSKNTQFQKMFDDYNSLVREHGFQFLNSQESTKLQEELRKFEQQLLNNNELNQAFNEDIDSYENSMIRNIYSYCMDNQFDKAVFMCGAAHRSSIIEKFSTPNSKENRDLNWEIYGN